MVGAVRKHDLLLTGSPDEVAEVLDDRAHALLGVVEPGQACEVVVVREHLAGDEPRGAGSPAEDDADVVELVSKPTREEEGADAEAGQDLRQLCGVPEAVGEVAGVARLDPEPAADPASEQEVADERLAADEDLVGEGVRRADLEAASGKQGPQPRLDAARDARGARPRLLR